MIDVVNGTVLLAATLQMAAAAAAMSSAAATVEHYGNVAASNLRTATAATTTAITMTTSTGPVPGDGDSGRDNGNDSGDVKGGTSAAAVNADASAAESDDNNHYTITQIVLIAILASTLSIVTVVGNSMVMISFKIDKQLQTISNYFLFSLAVADFAIGLISMPLFTVSTLLGEYIFTILII